MNLVEIGKPCWFLIPERLDSRPEFGNGQPHEAQKITDLLKRLEGLAGGATRSLSRAEVRGRWSQIEEFSVRYEIGLPEERVDKLFEILHEVVRDFGQECIYAVIHGVQAFLVYRTGGNQ